MKYIINTFLLLFYVILSSSHEIANAQVVDMQDTLDVSDTLVWDTIYKQKITNFVGKRILIHSKIRWDEGYGYNWELDEYEDTIRVGRIRTIFENYELYYNPIGGLTLSEPANIFIESDSISIRMNDKMSEQYFFSNDLMYRDSIDYYLYGIINYRDHLNVIGDGLNDTIFINQSNNLAYWSQTFKFTAINMKTTKHIEAPIINSSYHAKTVDFKVFPNPVTKNSTLAIDTDNGEQYTLTIFDVHGVILHACILVDRMNIGNILTASGIYFYTITHNGTLITSGKLIKE